jgi:hypothetical protein
VPSAGAQLAPLDLGPDPDAMFDPAFPILLPPGLDVRIIDHGGG